MHRLIPVIILQNYSIKSLFLLFTTVVLRREGPEFTYLGKEIDVVKEYGFSVDSATVFTETSQPIGNTTYLTDVYTVFMSRK